MSQDYIKTELAKYNLPDAKIAEMKHRYMPLKVESPNDMENYILCKDKHQEVRKIRIAIEKKRIELKASSLEFGKAVDGEAKRLTTGVLEVEDHLLSQRKVVEDEKKRIQEEKEHKEREEQERLKREEEERLEKQRLEQEEQARKLREEQERLDTQKREQEEKEQKLKEEEERQEREKKEAEEAKKRAKQEEIEAFAREKKRVEEVKNAKQEAIVLALKQKEEQEEATRLAEEKKKLLAPDKEKILLCLQELDSISMPQVKHPDAKALVDTISNRVFKLVEFAKEEAQKL